MFQAPLGRNQSRMIDAAARPDAIGGKPLEQGTEVYGLSGKEHQWVAICLKPYADGRLDVKTNRPWAAKRA
jgi:hypothetical protein